MKSIKPGRAPSMMGGIGAVCAAIFGIIWTVIALGNGVGGIFALFGVVFVCFAAASAIYNFKNATSKNRFSSFDITESGEETDPLNEKYGKKQLTPDGEEYYSVGDAHYCPYCGAQRQADFDFCPKCGRRLPE